MGEFIAKEIIKEANERGDDPMTTLVNQGVGAASACWENLRGAGVFDDQSAKKVSDELLEGIRELAYKPNLGLATTRELLAELTSRIEVDYSSGGGGLDYTTVHGRPSYF